ncbi:uncharacterized protein OCT59_011269 [Rhizophagus irregularis]|uniref:uncharacterized protein n=1 Tax=Rhizophagus irregularis TaxID=588596 RepID=UPI00332BEEEA|nr:hypothetical protein OCT59_011269 [Rhizophagus irregularis]
MKGYLDASTSLMTFITAFQSALDMQIKKTEFYVYQQDNFNILYLTTSLFKCQTVLILTTYLLKRIQEQLMQSFIYNCENISSQENNAELIFSTFTSEVENPNKVQSKVQSNTLNIIPTVKNPLVIRKKGHLSNKRIKSAGELTNKSNNKKKKKADENANYNMSKNLSFDNCKLIYIMQNIQPLYKIQNLITLSQHCTLLSFQVSHFNKSDFLSNKLNLKNDQDKNIKCSYCGETLPNLLPSKVSEYLNDILMEKKSTHTIVEQYEFCLVYKELKSDLLKIIKSQCYSKFCIDAVKRIQEIGKSKVDHPLYQINYFESFQPEYYRPKVQVLVSKTVIRLIAEDLGGIFLDMAKNVINDSIEFGFYIHKDSNT